MDTLNDASCDRPRGALIASIERESRLMRDVQRENGELRAALDDHRRALEFIMSKYRQHTEKRIWESRIDFTNAINEKQQEVCRSKLILTMCRLCFTLFIFLACQFRELSKEYLIKLFKYKLNYHYY